MQAALCRGSEECVGVRRGSGQEAACCVGAAERNNVAATYHLGGWLCQSVHINRGNDAAPRRMDFAYE
jgi:hypothetical protein